MLSRLRHGPPSRAGQLALVGGYPPTLAVGGGIILRRLLVGLETRLVVVCSGAVHDQILEGSGAALLDCDHHHVRPWSAPRSARRIMRVLNSLRTPFLALRLLRHVRGRSVLLVPWGGNLGSELFVAGWLAAMMAGSRLVVYELDDWDASLDDHQAWLVRVVGHAVHGRILRSAHVILAISPPLAEGLFDRYGVDADVLASALMPPLVAPASAAVPGQPTIVFIGAIYGTQADAIARLLRALNLLPGPIDLVLYTGSTEAELAAYSIAGPSLRLRSPVANEQVLSVLAQASALFLPASFLPEQCQTVKTSLPTKTAEYLWSGVPVLVHGPPDAVVCRLARAEGWGVVADTEDEEALAAAVTRILDNQALRAELAARARQTAAARHDLRSARRRIREVLGVEGRGG